MSVWKPRLSQTKYSDARNRSRADPDRERQSQLDWYMERYGVWRDLFNGTALEEVIPTAEDQSTGSEQNTYRWPVRFNLVRSYCMLYASLLWGRGQTGAQADDLFTIRVSPKIPGRPGPAATAMADGFKEILDYWWSFNFNKLRPAGATQQWAGGCVFKVCWDKRSPASVFGCQLQHIQPEFYYPIWNPVNVDDLLAVKIKFSIGKYAAEEIYNLTPAELQGYADNDKIPVEEHWNRSQYTVVLGRGKLGASGEGITARDPDGKPQAGPNPYTNPITGQGVVPFVYIPRINDGSGYFGDSLAYSLEGLQGELNKTLADFGEALTLGSHPPFGISDYTGPGSRGTGKASKEIHVPRHGALNMGRTTPGGEPPKVHLFPTPKVPDQTSEFTDRLLSLSEVASGLTPAARGATQSARSGFAMAMELLPTTTTIDWERSHWTTGIAGLQGINRILGVIWCNKLGLPDIPTVVPSMLLMPQEIEYKPVVPRDKVEVIDEVVRLATARVVSPQEWLKRLGDVENLDDEFKNLAAWLVWIGSIDAAVAGRAIQISQGRNPENPALALPQVAGQTEGPKTKQPAKQPQGLGKPKE